MNTVKILAIPAIVCVTLGGVILSIGAISLRNTTPQEGANIGADVSFLFGIPLVGLGLLLGIACGATYLVKRSGTKRSTALHHS